MPGISLEGGRSGREAKQILRIASGLRGAGNGANDEGNSVSDGRSRPTEMPLPREGDTHSLRQRPRPTSYRVSVAHNGKSLVEELPWKPGGAMKSSAAEAAADGYLYYCNSSVSLRNPGQLEKGVALRRCCSSNPV